MSAKEDLDAALWRLDFLEGRLFDPRLSSSGGFHPAAWYAGGAARARSGPLATGGFVTRPTAALVAGRRPGKTLSAWAALTSATCDASSPPTRQSVDDFVNALAANLRFQLGEDGKKGKP